MGRRENAGIWTAGILIIGITLYSAWELIGTGVLAWHASQREYHFMIIETLCLWLTLFSLFRWSHNRFLTWGGTAILLAAFSWLHVIFLPMLLAGCYVIYLVLVGRWTEGKLGRRMGMCWEFLFGSAVTILAFCMLSLAGLGSIRNLRVWVAVTGLALLLRERGQWLSRGRQWLRERGRGRGEREKSFACAAMTAAILSLLLLQAGRLNLAVDFDSLWYGVRSHVMLDSGNGIYENLGTLGIVYTYPKGWETLTLPLAGLPSYSFSTSMNLWVSGLTLLVLYETAAIYLEPQKALWAPFLASSVPGLMNMSVTAKADMMTLFCQILMIQAMLRYEKERDGNRLILGLAAGGVSLVMKPTAVVFSTVVTGVGALWLLGRRGNKEKPESREKPDRRFWRFLVLSLGALAGIWGRTLYLVGVPVTSVFYQVFQKMGFRVKYPFYASGFPSAGSDLTVQEQLVFLGRRLYGLLLNPQGQDMAHVIIAWGGVLPLAFFVFCFCFRLVRRKDKDIRKRQWELSFLVLLLAALLFVDLVSLYSLSQIDGNYYMLTYALAILTGCVWLERSGPGKRRMAGAALMPAWCYGVLLCGLTNWAWALGNGGLHLANKGYYPHLEREKEVRAAQGSAAIWDILASDPKTRVIALGEHPGVLSFPCWVQSYVDVSGYWGNPEVVANAPNFCEYLRYANVDYLYMEKEYIDESVRIYQIIRTLIQEGWLYDVRDENGNLILSVRKGDQKSYEEEVEKNLHVFDERYVQHP